MVPATDKLLLTSTVWSIHQLQSYLYEESTNSTHTVHMHNSMQKYVYDMYVLQVTRLTTLTNCQRWLLGDIWMLFAQSLDSLHWTIAKGGCSVTSGCCLPSASDKWYSPKRALTQWQSSNSTSFCKSRYVHFCPDSWNRAKFWNVCVRQIVLVPKEDSCWMFVILSTLMVYYCCHGQRSSWCKCACVHCAIEAWTFVTTNRPCRVRQDQLQWSRVICHLKMCHISQADFWSVWPPLGDHFL